MRRIMSAILVILIILSHPISIYAVETSKNPETSAQHSITVEQTVQAGQSAVSHNASGETSGAPNISDSSYIIPNLPAVRDQKTTLNLCWAHAIMAAVETNLIQKGYADSSINLSELQFAWFHHMGTQNANGQYDDPLCNFGGDYNRSVYNNNPWGGDKYYTAAKSLASWVGAVQEDDTTEYSEKNAASIQQNGLDYSYAYSKDVAHLENVRMIPANAGVDAIKAALLQYGALGLSYCVESSYTTSFSQYYYAKKGDDTDHAVAIVGWDDTINKSSFLDKNVYQSPQNNGAWIVRNSSGSDWGNSGYFYMSYESSYVSKLRTDKDFTTAEEQHIIYAFDCAPADKYSKCYQYDGTSSTVHTEISGTNPTIANVFTADSEDIIGAVSFWMDEETDVSYTIKVYTNLTDDNNPVSGTLVSEVSGQTDYAGYYTVSLPKGIYVNKGEKFSAIVEVTNKEKVNFPLDKDQTISEYIAYHSYSAQGQSFYKADNTWVDQGVNNGGNFRIKAFAINDAPVLSISSSEQDSHPELSWTLTRETASYNIYRAITADGEYSLIGTSTEMRFTDVSAVSGTRYYYKVTSVTTHGKESDFSNSVSRMIGNQKLFIISYDANDGKNAPEYQTKVKGEELTLSSQIPTRENYTFLGWSTDKSSSKADYLPEGSFTIEADTTLYAVWYHGKIVDDPMEMYSDHNYGNNMDARWLYTNTNASSISLTFDSQTFTENNFDFIYIYDGNDNKIGEYSGNQLAGKTMKIEGDTVCIRLTSDGASPYWGFKVSNYEITLKNVEPGIPVKVASDTNGTSASVVVTENNKTYPGVTASGLDVLAKQIKNSNKEENVELSLNVEAAKEDKTSGNQIAIQKAAAGKDGFTFLGISLSKTIGSQNELISDTQGSLLEIIVPLDISYRKDPVVYRVHGETAPQAFTQASSGSNDYGKDGTFYIEGSGTDARIHFFTDKFSDYALAYTTVGNIAFEGGSLRRRVQTGDEKKVVNSSTDIRFEFTVYLPEGTSIDTEHSYFLWTAADSEPQTLSGKQQVMLKNYEKYDLSNTYKANLVLTGVPSANFDTEIYAQLHVAYKFTETEDTGSLDSAISNRSVNKVITGLIKLYDKDNKENTWYRYARYLKQDEGYTEYTK